MEAITIALHEDSFHTAERLQVRHGPITIHSFRYSTGVAALRVRTDRGEIVLLPFQGHQLWSVSFAGRELAMKSVFVEPRKTSDFLSTYGAFFVHCGACAMGRPGPTDNHPIHGELPNAPFDECTVHAGWESDGTPCVDVGGRYHHKAAFTADYIATSRVRIRGGRTYLGLSLAVENLRVSPMELMYMAHINFRPITHSRVVASAPLTPDNMEFRPWPATIRIPDAHAKFVELARKDPGMLATILPSHVFDPELVFSVGYQPDADGWAHTLQVHPDGSADFVRHDPAELPVGTRWIVRTGSEDAFGIILPGTAGPEGFAKEKSRGRIVMLAPGGTWQCTVEVGVLNPEETRSMVAAIDLLNHRHAGGK